MRKIQILGTGCNRCHTLYENACQAVKQTGTEFQVVKVTDIVEMLSFHALGLPALAIDGQVKASGRVLTAEEIGRLLSPAAGG
ncbi:MAG: thioredoxin family protein [Gemmataceae bacterium]